VRFETRYDRWLVILLVVAAVVTCVILPAQLMVRHGPHPPPRWIPFLPWALWLLVAVATLPQYYEVREDGLFLRQGWRRILLPYESLNALECTTGARSAGVYSMQRILITTREGRRYLIAVAREDEFLAEVGRRSPQLSRTGFGLGISLA
jgi:hypothetical protein